MAFELKIDCTQLYFQRFILPNVTRDWVDARSVQSFSVEPGTFNFQISSGAYADFRFAVDGAGLVQFDSTFDGFLSGRGTDTLVVRGLDITLDARALSGANGNGVGGVLFVDSPLTSSEWITYRTIRLVPCLYRLQQSSGRVVHFTFHVDVLGSVTYHGSFGSFVSGQGTSALTLRGFPINIDASAASRYLYVQPGWGFPSSSDGTLSLVVLPADDFYLQLDRGVTELFFSVSLDGAIAVKASLRQVLDIVAQSGVPTLIVRPHTTFQSPVFGTNSLGGILHEAWKQAGSRMLPSGESVQQHLGTTVEDTIEVSVGGARTAIVQRFERGALMDIAGRNRPAAIYGDTYLRYHAQGGVAGHLGAPTEEPTAAGRLGTVATFERGKIYSHPRTGSFEVHGAILARYLQLGGPGGFGYPLSNEEPVRATNGTIVGRMSRFEGGTIYWSRATGAHEVRKGDTDEKTPDIESH